MVQALVGKTVIADSDKTIMIEGNHYFPPNSINRDYFTDSDLHTTCVWKGEASYYNVEAGGKKLENAAWYYPNPISERAMPIKDYVAFYGNIVKIKE